MMEIAECLKMVKNLSGRIWRASTYTIFSKFIGTTDEYLTLSYCSFISFAKFQLCRPNCLIN